MPRAVWNNAVLAECDQPEMVEGNHYFPPESIRCEYFQESEAQTICSWKGTASYFDICVDGKVNAQAAWYYSDPLPAAENIKGYIAFWKGVVVED